MFVTMHQSVAAISLRMYQALKRRNHVTPTSYLETAANYKTLLGEKRTELAGKANKLKGGLAKLDETRTHVRTCVGHSRVSPAT
jgi:dynein heavy chain